MSDYDKLCTAVSILQMHILAMDTVLDPGKMFGVNHMKTPALEMALQLMTDALDGADDGLNIGKAA